MRKKFFLIIVLFVLFFPTGVFAYDKLELIPVDEVATVEAVEYTYKNFRYINQVEGETYGVLKFDSVVNKSHYQKPLAIDFLLFNSDKINIGFVAYCSTKDLKGEYAQVVVNATASSPLTVFIDSSYFVEGYTKDNIAYLAVLDGNEKCYVGNSNKYAGLTIEEIAEGKVSPDWKDNDFVNIFSFILNIGIYSFLGLLLVIMSVYTIYIVMLNTLHKKMFGKKAKFRFVPVINYYISLKVSFGRIIAFLGLLCLIGAIYFIIFNSDWLVFGIVLGLLGMSIVINIIKYYKHNYNLFFFDPFIKNDGKNPIFSWRKVKVTGQRKAKQILNLNYSDQDLQTQLLHNQGPAPIVPVAVPQVDTAEDIINRIDNNVDMTQNAGFQMPNVVSNPVNQEVVPPVNNPVVVNSVPVVNSVEPVMNMVPDNNTVVSNESTNTIPNNPVVDATPNELNNAVPSEVPANEVSKEDSQSEFMDMFR